MLPGGHELWPVIVQQNSVYPSQHAVPQLQLRPRQVHTAPYALTGRRTKSIGFVVNAVPTMADLTSRPRRLVWVDSSELVFSINQRLTRQRHRGLPATRREATHGL